MPSAPLLIKLRYQPSPVFFARGCASLRKDEAQPEGTCMVVNISKVLPPILPSPAAINHIYIKGYVWASRLNSRAHRITQAGGLINLQAVHSIFIGPWLRFDRNENLAPQRGVRNGGNRANALPYVLITSSNPHADLPEKAAVDFKVTEFWAPSEFVHGTNRARSSENAFTGFLWDVRANNRGIAVQLPVPCEEHTGRVPILEAISRRELVYRRWASQDGVSKVRERRLGKLASALTSLAAYGPIFGEASVSL
ncbi:hypothetical protein DFH07DRAFT_766925 [Mycena maculata]|uniref:Uncharacterized protein n=1 Tax=Mycena maculata TaxID=230809 RepID=A0AAD7K0S7_9AGAR|nr:hypothetical protein DFH07DRAFT_766925 [Mycena maculata]